MSAHELPCRGEKQKSVVVKNKTQLEGTAFTTGADGMELYTVSGALAADQKTVTMALKPVGAGKPAVIQAASRDM